MAQMRPRSSSDTITKALPVATIELRRAAEYVRMSTEGQQYSIPRQQAAIREYAEKHGYAIVRSYLDPGRSGVGIKGRHGLLQLLEDVQHGTPDFGAILVYDVSRWGRFQDIDESAYYEFLCRHAGFQVEYCVELFRNDGSLWSAILKNLKRVAAAEYSRDQSMYVRRSKAMTAARGEFPGGTTMYGMQRVLLRKGEEARVLNKGEHRAIKSDPVVLTPGPPHEVRTVRRVFRLFVEKQKTRTEIATLLNKTGVTTRRGLPWDIQSISYMLRNEAYAGTQCYNRHSRRGVLGGPYQLSEPHELVRAPGAFPAIVSRSLFDAAQEILRQQAQSAYTDASLLEHLRYLRRKHGYLSISLIDSHGEPNFDWYQRRFGGALKAYQKIGYVQNWRGTRKRTLDRKVKPIMAAIRTTLTKLILKRGISVAYDRLHRCLFVGGAIRVSVTPMTWQLGRRKRRPGWYWQLTEIALPRYRVVVRLDDTNRHPLDYMVLPPGRIWSDNRNFNEHRLKQLCRFRCRSLEQVANRLLTELV